MIRGALALSLTVFLSGACASSVVSPGAIAPAVPPWSAPALERAVAVRGGRTNAPLSFDRLLDALAEADAVFLGELHTDETTHRVELAVYEGLLARRGGRVVLALEMFERDVQPALDAYLAGASTETAFLAAARPWTNYATAYRPMIERARAERLPVVASNFPAPLRRKLASSSASGASALDALAAGDRALAPRELLANTDAYWRRVDNAVRGHRAMMGGSAGGNDARLTSGQSLWDNSMGEACALALERHPGHLVLHVNGGFHSAYFDGTVRQLLLRRPATRVRTVSIVPTPNPAVADAGGAPVADYVVFAEERATDLNDGTYSVAARREIDYRLHLPKGSPPESGWPLLLWFGDDGLTAKDGLALWRDRLGDACAIAVLEAPYKETQDDLVEGGRWFWPDTFASDLGTLVGATEEAWAFLLRHHPIDPGRVCVAGEGTGATVVSAISLRGGRMGARGVGFAPSRYAKLKDLPLPLPEDRGDAVTPEKSLALFLPAEDEPWWFEELAEYRAVGLESGAARATEDPWLREAEREAALRSVLGLPDAAGSSGAGRRHFVADGPRARHWARLKALAMESAGGVSVAVLDAPPEGSVEGAGSTEVDLRVRAADFASGEGIPRCPGPFGGTTVVVLPESTPREEADAWRAIERDDPVQRRSRFHRLRVVAASGERRLVDVLQELRDAGRTNVLVVPATFAADGETMRALRRSVRGLDDSLTIRWLPGLGGPAE